MSIFSNYKRLLVESNSGSYRDKLLKILNDAIELNFTGRVVEVVLTNFKLYIEEKSNSNLSPVMTDYDATYTYESVWDLTVNNINLPDVFMLTIKNNVISLHYGDEQELYIDKPFVEDNGFEPIKQLVEKMN